MHNSLLQDLECDECNSSYQMSLLNEHVGYQTAIPQLVVDLGNSVNMSCHQHFSSA